ncbi:hypothetical protein BC826DRAFT_1023805 [Russula brevipes]|nr:hypothetical protein BC826DRAFT_1023805 [Russula brevipes]
MAFNGLGSTVLPCHVQLLALISLCFPFSLATNLPVYKLQVYCLPRDRKIYLSTHYQNRRVSVRVPVPRSRLLVCRAAVCLPSLLVSRFLPFLSFPFITSLTLLRRVTTQTRTSPFTMALLPLLSIPYSDKAVYPLHVLREGQ